jgi:hypothetical protein
MAYKNPFEIKTKSDGSYFESYTKPKIAVTPISSANGEKSSAIGSGETSENINSALEQSQDDPTGFNRNLNKRIKRADNIAQQTRLNIKLDKKEQRQKKRAQKMLDKNPEYAKRASDKAESKVDASLSKLDAAMNQYNPTNGYKARGEQRSMPTTNLMSDGGGFFGLSKSVANGSTKPKQSNLLSKGFVDSIRSASIPNLKSSIPAHNTTGSTLDVTRRGKQGTSNTSGGGAGTPPGSGRVVESIGPLSGKAGSYSNQSVFGSGRRNMGFGGGNPLSGRQFHKPPKVKSSIHSKSPLGINKPNFEKYL